MELPKPLIEEIQKYYSGGYLWFDKVNYQKRNQEIAALKSEGMTALEIAQRVKLTPRRVCQILKSNTKQEKLN